jgi:hypothetical protein
MVTISLKKLLPKKSKLEEKKYTPLYTSISEITLVQIETPITESKTIIHKVKPKITSWC